VESLRDELSVTLILIGVNVLASLFGFWALGRKRYRPWVLFMPYQAARGRNGVGMVLSHFTHGDLGHLIVNLVALYFFGPPVEAALGPGPYLILYTVSGAAASLAVFALRHKDRRHAVLGASGSISGVLFAAVVVAPSTSVYLFFVPIPIPAPVFAVLYLLISSFLMRTGDRVSHEAHIGGAVVGFLLAGIMYERGFAPLVRAVRQLL
jgi:membrane associated rhomboid family serine protease